MEETLAALANRLALRGLNLQERARLHASLGAAGWGEQAPDDGSRALLDQWRRRLEASDLWEDRLASLRVEGAAFSQLGAVPAQPALQVVAGEIERVLRPLLAPASGADVPYRRRQYGQGLPPLPPALQRYVETRFYAAASDRALIDSSRCPDLGQLVENEVNYTLEDLYYHLLPALTTELHVAGARGALKGDSAERRFESYCADLVGSTDWLMEFLVTYPVAVRYTETVVRTRIRNFVELLQRFEADYSALRIGRFLADDAGATLQHISPWSGDRHREGRSVRIVDLANGGRVVYKPRPVHADVAFQAAVRWLNEKGFTPDLYVLPIVQREGYGWFRYVEPRDAHDAAAVGRFYRRQGAHLALLYLFGGRDILADNVRGHGEYPVLLDLECLVSARLPAFAGRLYDSAARQYLEESVSWTGLLPAWSWAHLGRDAVDLSGLTAPDGQLTPQDIPYWVDRGSDTLRQARRRAEIPYATAHLAAIAGVAQPVNDFMDEFHGGFHDGYAVLEANRQELLAGPLLDAFGAAQSRVLLRNTVDYHTLLDAMRHPRCLSDALRSSELLDRLWAGRCPRYLAAVIEAEIEQLWRADIPLFSTLGDSRDLFDADGRLIARNYFAESGMDAVRRRLTRLGPADLARQREVMDGAFEIAELPRPGAGEISANGRSDRRSAALPRLASAELLGEAAFLADRLLATAMEDETSLNWIGLAMNETRQWSHGALDASLHDGFIGIALFFLYLDALSHQPRFEGAWRKILEHGALQPARRVLESRARIDGWTMNQPNGFAFPFSALYFGVQAAHLGKMEELDSILEAALAVAAAGLRRAPRFDFVSGAAGVIRVLLVAYRFTGSARALELARSYGDQLVAQAVPAGPGIGWPSDFDNLPALMGGFSHGASGIAWVLADLARESGDGRYADVSDRALAYDRTLFSGERDDWVDLREPARPGSAVQWCHGPAGIGLSRTLLARYSADPSLAADIARAVQVTLTAEPFSDCLCHGSLGNLDICSIAARQFDNSGWSDATDAYALRVFRAAHARGHWRGGVPGHDVGSQGLLLGTAGVGYGLLRLARPDRVPSILCLEDPK